MIDQWWIIPPGAALPGALASGPAANGRALRVTGTRPGDDALAGYGGAKANDTTTAVTAVATLIGPVAWRLVT